MSVLLSTNCAVCPHQSDCQKIGSCLDEINAAQLAKRRSCPYPTLMTPTQVGECMEALQHGLTLRRITGGGKAGKMIVSLTKFRAHCAAYPEWGGEALRLAKLNTKAANALKGGRKGKYAAFCKRSLHAMVGDNVVTSKHHDTRYCKACWAERSQRPMTAEEITRVKQALASGWTTRKVTDGIPIGGGPKDKSIAIVPARVFFGECKRDPEFAQFVKSATVNNTKRGQHIRYTRARTIAVRDDNNDYYKIRGMISESNPHRDDIVARIFEDLLSDKLDRKSVPDRIRDYVAEFNRMFPAQYRKFGDGLLVSLDEALFDDGGGTRGDNVTHNLWT